MLVVGLLVGFDWNHSPTQFVRVNISMLVNTLTVFLRLQHFGRFLMIRIVVLEVLFRKVGWW